MKDLTYDQLIELAPKKGNFEIIVDSNPKNKGGRKKLLAYICDDGKTLNTYFTDPNQINIDGIRYVGDWEVDYKGTFTLVTPIDIKEENPFIDPRYQKPEVLKVGQKVRIMESARDVGYYRTSKNSKEITNQIGELNIIDRVLDDDYGIYYETKKGYRFPHYCVMPVEEDKVQEVPELENTLEQLDNLISKAQDIISKYKK